MTAGLVVLVGLSQPAVPGYLTPVLVPLGIALYQWALVPAAKWLMYWLVTAFIVLVPRAAKRRLFSLYGFAAQGARTLLTQLRRMEARYAKANAEAGSLVLVRTSVNQP